jgi:hypothetical protein
MNSESNLAFDHWRTRLTEYADMAVINAHLAELFSIFLHGHTLAEAADFLREKVGQERTP